MNEELKYKELISRYIDGETTAEETDMVITKLSKDASLKQYFHQLQKLDGILKEKPQEALSPDWENKITSSLSAVESREDIKMKKKRIWSTSVGGGVLATLLIMGLLSVQVYVKRGVQGRLRQATDDIGDQFSPGNMTARLSTSRGRYKQSADDVGQQYSPYYLNNSYTSEPYQVASNSSMSTQASTAGDSIPQARQLVKKAEVNLKVEDVQKTFQQLYNIINQVGGTIVNSVVSEGNSSYNSQKNGVTVFKVRPNHFDKALEQVSTLGEVTAKVINADDVSSEYVDLQARLTSAREVKNRLVQILENKATLVRDILSVEQEIARLVEKMERIQGQMEYLKRQVAESTITVNYHEPVVNQPVAWSLDFINKFKDSFKIAATYFVDGINFGFIVLAVVLPFVLWIGFVGCMIYMGQCLFRRKTA